MTEMLKVNVDRRGGLAVIYTEGYINNQGGEEIARAAYDLISDDEKNLLLNLKGTKIVNSIGISILIEIIEKMLWPSRLLPSAIRTSGQTSSALPTGRPEKRV
jgi:hypothetical protein